MGYYVEGNGYLVVKKENLAAAHEALMKLQDAPDSAKRGGAHSGGKQTASWYSWMPEDLRTLPDTQSVFETLGFEIEVLDNGDIVIGHYDNKIGQEEVFFAAAAPFIEDGEYEWIGEDGAFWTWEFNGGTMYRKEGHRSYGEAVEVGARS
jgi:hypothetical protein